MFSTGRRIASSPLLALTVALAAWAIPSVHLRIIVDWVLALISTASLYTIWIYWWRWWQYIRSLESRGEETRALILSRTGFDLAEGGVYSYQISAIANRDGTVHFVLPVTMGCGLRIGARLAAIHTATSERWGAVEVVEMDETSAHAKPVDRSHPAFWEKLEDRMRHDPSAPEGFHLEPDLEPAFIQGDPKPRRGKRNG
jgi:hypothetical protein